MIRPLIPYICKDSNQSFVYTGLPLPYFLLLASADIQLIQEGKFRQESKGAMEDLNFLSLRKFSYINPLGNLHCQLQLKQVYTEKLGGV